MRYEVWNFGITKRIPYLGEYIELLHKSGIETKDREMAEHLGKFPDISVKEIMPVARETKRNRIIKKEIRR